MSIRLLVMADGRSVHTERWCGYFESEGFTTALFSLESITIAHPKIKFQGRRPTGKGLIDYSLAKWHFSKIINEFRPDIISAHYVNSYGWLASFCDVCPVAVTAWGSDLLILPDKWKIHRIRIQKALDHARLCTVDNQNLFDAANRFMPEDKIIRIVMGIDEYLHRSIRKEKFSSQGTLRVIAPRGLKPVYDPATIITAASQLHPGTDIRIAMLGHVAEIGQFETMIKDNGASERISIESMFPHAEYLQSLPHYDIYLSASLSDSTSVALLEALSVGLFPVVSDIPGNREWIVDGENGLLFEPGNAAALTDALKRALSMRESFKAIAEDNHARIGRTGIWQHSMAHLKNIFVEMAG